MFIYMFHRFNLRLSQSYVCGGVLTVSCNADSCPLPSRPLRLLHALVPPIIGLVGETLYFHGPNHIFLLSCRFTYVAVCLFRVREFLDKLEELVGKVSYQNDPVKSQKPKMQKRAETLLKDLLQRSHLKTYFHRPSCSLIISLLNVMTL